MLEYKYLLIYKRARFLIVTKWGTAPASTALQANKHIHFLHGANGSEKPDKGPLNMNVRLWEQLLQPCSKIKRRSFVCKL